MTNLKSPKVTNQILNVSTVVFMFCGLAACTQKTSNQYVARVNQVPISKEVLQDRLTTYQYDQHLNSLDNNNDVKQAVVNELIQEQLIMQLATQRNLSVPPQEIQAEAEEFGIQDPEQEPETIELIRRRLLEKKLFELITQSVSAPSTEEVAQHYQKNQLQFVQKPQIHLLQIIFKQEEDLDQARKMLTDGTSFEELVKIYEKKPMLAMAGDLGFVAEGMLQADLEKIAFSLGKDQISKPIETEIGWAWLKVLDKKEEKTYTIEEVQEQIQTQLWIAKKERHYNQWLKTQIAQANIERNHEIIQQPTP